MSKLTRSLKRHQCFLQNADLAELFECRPSLKVQVLKLINPDNTVVPPCHLDYGIKFGEHVDRGWGGRSFVHLPD